MKYIIWVMFAFSVSIVHAAEWEAIQGDVLAVSLHSQASIQSVKTLGKTWPVQQLRKGVWKAWVGVDLKKKPANYPLTWHADNKIIMQDVLHVRVGKFRVSRIEVPKKMSNFDAKAIKRIRADQVAIKATYSIDVPIEPDFSVVHVPVHGIESTPFGAQRYVNGQPRSPHAGIDIAAAKGTPVLAPLAGKVLLVLPMFLNGNLIAIGHGAGLVSVYAHLSHFDVKQGDVVMAGQKIGEVGSTGRSTGAHLHWGVRFQHARVNPESLLSLAKQPENIAE